jgi:hypothetical protein
LQERLLSASTAVHTLDEEVSKQLHNIRSDVKQAITVATKSVRADLEAAARTRRQEETTQLKEQLRSTSQLHHSRQQEHRRFSQNSAEHACTPCSA